MGAVQVTIGGGRNCHQCTVGNWVGGGIIVRSHTSEASTNDMNSCQYSDGIITHLNTETI